MDVAEGTLEQRLNAGPVTITEAKEIVRSIAAGLQFLHSKNMVHRDLKPGNVLCVGGKWQLADFGLIRAFGSETAAYTQNITGTPYFMPPESFKGEMSPAWDVWSLGVLIVFAFTRQYPFTGASHHEVANAILTQPPRIASPLPAPFDAIVQGCLVKDRRTRMTASQVLASLGGSSVVAPAKTPPAPKPQPISQPAQILPQSPLPAKPQRSGAAGRWAAFAAVATVAAFAWHSLSGNRPSEPAHFDNPVPAHHKFVLSHHQTHVKQTHAAFSNVHPRPTHHVVILATRHLHQPLLPAVPHTNRIASNASPAPHVASYTPKPRSFYHVSHVVAYRPRPTRSSIGDLHSDSDIGSHSSHSENSNTISSSNGDVGNLH